MASEKPSNVMDDEESIKGLYEGKRPIRADMVFVHGLAGNGSGTRAEIASKRRGTRSGRETFYQRLCRQDES